MTFVEPSESVAVTFLLLVETISVCSALWLNPNSSNSFSVSLFASPTNVSLYADQIAICVLPSGHHIFSSYKFSPINLVMCECLPSVKENSPTLFAFSILIISQSISLFSDASNSTMMPFSNLK
jgi:hypothetical protein